MKLNNSEKYTALSALFFFQERDKQVLLRAIRPEMLKKRGRKCRIEIRRIPNKALLRHLTARVPNLNSTTPPVA
jgi:hypothetical protein